MLTPLASALAGWDPGSGQPHPAADPIVLLGVAWADIVGDEIARNSHPSQINGSALIVTTRSSAWSHQLSFLAERILTAVRARVPSAGVDQMRFRVGRITPAGATRRGSRAAAARKAVLQKQPPSASSEEALARFRDAVDAQQRAKRSAGWKECFGCNALIAPGATLCVSCVTARDEARQRLVAQLLFEAPWLGYVGTAALVEQLTPAEYEAVRRKILTRWWEILARVRATRRLSRDGRERLIASSYVVLKSGVAPERVAPAVVRNVLGDELHDLIYETEPNNKTNVE